MGPAQACREGGGGIGDDYRGGRELNRQGSLDRGIIWIEESYG